MHSRVELVARMVGTVGMGSMLPPPPDGDGAEDDDLLTDDDLESQSLEEAV